RPSQDRGRRLVAARDRRLRLAPRDPHLRVLVDPRGQRADAAAAARSRRQGVPPLPGLRRMIGVVHPMIQGLPRYFARPSAPGMISYSDLALPPGIAFVIAGAIVVLTGVLSPRHPTPAKARPYECGVSEPFTTETRWPVRFALVAMLFLIFDVEALFFYPW